MRKLGIWIAVILVLLLIGVAGNNIVYKDELKGDYYGFIVTISELFKNHAQEEEYFYNRSYSKEEEIAALLDGKVTEAGFNLVVHSLFDELNDLYVYKPHYQEYISDTRDFSYKQKDTNFYGTVRNTILNPALGLIPFEDLKITKEKNRVTIKGQEIRVKFYEDNDSLLEHRYSRFGFPPEDQISFSLVFVYESGKYLLDDFLINPQEM